MKCLLRWAFNFVAAVSAVLFVAVGVLKWKMFVTTEYEWEGLGVHLLERIGLSSAIILMIILVAHKIQDAQRRK